MSTKHQSINRSIPVTQLLELFNCRPRLPGLPLKTSCPVCRDGTLSVFSDWVCGGGWHHCEQCGTRGDMVALTAAILRVSLPEAISHLACRGFNVPTDDDEIAYYLREHVGYDARLNDLWERAIVAHRRPRPEFWSLVYRLGLRAGDWRGSWRDHIGHCIGWLTKTVVETAFAPQVMSGRVSWKSGSCSAHRTFYGRDWEGLLALPFYDLPGRLASFLFVGRDANPQQDFVLRRANRGPRGNQHVAPEAEAGITLFPDLFPAANAMNRTILTVSDPVLMLKMHSRHSRFAHRQLPISAWIDSDQWPSWETLGRRTRTNAAWQMFIGYKTVFWCPLGLNIHSLRQAMRADGWISTVGPRIRTPENLEKYLNSLTPEEIFERVVERAVPWPEAMRIRFRRWKDPEIKRWLIRLEHERESLQPILSRCDPYVAERVRRVCQAVDWSRSIQFNGRTIVEADRSWSVQQDGRPIALISDALLRIDRVLGCNSSGRRFVSGRVIYQSHEIPIHEPLELLQKDAMRLMVDVVLEHGLGLVQYDRQFAKHVFQIALAFQPPSAAEPIRRVGLDVGAGQLWMPAFTLELGGTVKPKTENFVPGPLPATAIAPPQDLTDCQLNALAMSSEAMPIVWATMASVIANVVAAEFGTNPVGLCLVGQGAQTVGMDAAEALGCLRLPVNLVADVERALQTERNHDWPVIFDIGRNLRPVRHIKLLRNSEEGRRCILGTDQLVSQIMLVHGHWLVIENDRPLSVPPAVLRSITAILPAYLQNLMSRNCLLGGGGNFAELPLRVLDDIAAFVEECGGDPIPVAQVERLFAASFGPGPSEIFMIVLGKLICLGKLTVQHVRDKRCMLAVLENPKENVIAIPQTALSAAFLGIPAPIPDSGFMTDLLTGSVCFRESIRSFRLFHRDRLCRLWREFGVLPEALAKFDAECGTEEHCQSESRGDSGLGVQPGSHSG